MSFTTTAVGGVSSVRGTADQFMTIMMIEDRMLTGFEAFNFMELFRGKINNFLFPALLETIGDQSTMTLTIMNTNGDHIGAAIDRNRDGTATIVGRQKIVASMIVDDLTTTTGS